MKRIEIDRKRAKRIAEKANRDGRLVDIWGDDSRGSITITIKAVQ